MLHRLTKIPLSKQDYNDELNTIKYIAIKNGYNPNLINKLHKHIINKNNKTLNINNSQQTKYITLTIPQLQHTQNRQYIQETQVPVSYTHLDVYKRQPIIVLASVTMM